MLTDTANLTSMLALSIFPAKPLSLPDRVVRIYGISLFIFLSLSPLLLALSLVFATRQTTFHESASVSLALFALATMNTTTTKTTTAHNNGNVVALEAELAMCRSSSVCLK